MPDFSGPSERVLAAAVARRHYLDGASKVEIAEALGISRFKVARLLDAARSSGMVRIEIARDDSVDTELSEAVRAALGLRRVVVVAGMSEPRRERAHVGATAAELLVEVIGPDDVLGLPWSRTVDAMVSALSVLPPNPVVQLTGSLVLPDEDSSSVDVVRRAARLAGGDAYVFYAPMILDDEASAAMIRRQPPVVAAMAQIPRVTVAVVGIGAWREGDSTIHDIVGPDVRAAVAAAGAVGEVAGVFFDDEGADVANPLTARLIVPTNEQLRAVPEVIAIAHGESKALAIRAAVRGGLVTSLVTTTATARRLLEGG